MFWPSADVNPTSNDLVHGVSYKCKIAFSTISMTKVINRSYNKVVYFLTSEPLVFFTKTSKTDRLINGMYHLPYLSH